MTVNKLYSILNEKIPASLSCEWDNDGLMCCPDGEREVTRALVTLDVTEGVVREAVSGGYDVIISHHPFIFSPLRSLDETDFIPRKAMELIRHGISVMSFHTRLDALCGGVNDTLAARLGLTAVYPFGDDRAKMGRIGTLGNSMTLDEFASMVKKSLAAPTVLCADASRPVSKVAVLGGEGSDFIKAAIAEGADTCLSGRLGYHNMTDAPDMGINLIEAGHFFTEYPVCDTLCQMLSELGIECDKYFSNRIYTV